LRELKVPSLQGCPILPPVFFIVYSLEDEDCYGCSPVHSRFEVITTMPSPIYFLGKICSPSES